MATSGAFIRCMRGFTAGSFCAVPTVNLPHTARLPHLQNRLCKHHGSWALHASSAASTDRACLQRATALQNRDKWGLQTTGQASPSPSWSSPCKDIVRHVYAPVSSLAWEAVSKCLDCDEERARALIELGCLYFKSDNAPVTAKPKRNLDPDLEVKAGEYIRVYPQPRRYPAWFGVDWESRIVYETEELMLVNKPPGVPCHATVDNYRENVVEGLKKARPGLMPLLPHRLDLDTSGLMIVAKCLTTLRTINTILKEPGIKLQAHEESPQVRRRRLKALRRRHEHGITDKSMKEAVRESGGTDGAAASEIGVDASLAGKKLGTDATVENDPAELPGRLTKRYRALVEVLPGSSPLSPGLLTHYLKTSPRAPKEFRRDHPEKSEMARDVGSPIPWLECRMSILSVRDVRSVATHPAVKHGASAPNGDAPRLQEIEVELLTGRTHQIRGQAAAEGCPILGDKLYRNCHDPSVGDIGLVTFSDEKDVIGQEAGEDLAAVAGENTADVTPRQGERGNGGHGLMIGGFVDSPNLALQAYSINLEIYGRIHACSLPREICWWVP